MLIILENPMKKTLALFALLTISGLLFLISCQFKNSDSNELVFATLEMNLDSRSSNYVSQTRGPASFSDPSVDTSLVIVVPDDITSANYSGWDDETYYDARLAIISARTVTLTVPLGVSIRLVKLDFNGTHTVEQLKAANPFPLDKGISSAFTVTTGTTSMTVTIDMDSISASGSWGGTRITGTTGWDHAHGIATDADGNLYIAGHIDGTWDGQVPVSSNDAYYAKFSSNGTLQHVRLISGDNSDNGTDVAVDSAGNVYVTGHTSSSTLEGATVDFPPQQFLAKFNSSGVFEDVQIIGSSATRGDENKRIIISDTDQIFLVDATNGLMVYDSSLSLIDSTTDFDVTVDTNWDRTTGIAYDNSSGSIFVAFYDNSEGYTKILRYNSALGISYDMTTDLSATWDSKVNLVVDDSSNLYITGTIDGSTDVPYDGETCPSSGGNDEVYVKKYNSAMVRQWTSLVCSVGYDFSWGINVDSSQRVYISGGVVGYFDGFSPSGAIDIFVARLDSGGTLSWVYQLGGSNTEYGEELVLDSDSNFIITGSTDSTSDGFDGVTGPGGSFPAPEDVFLVKFSSDGDLL